VSYLFAFSPWIVYAVIPSAQWRWGALAALAITVAVLIAAVARRRPASSLIIELGTVVFFVFAAVLAFTGSHATLHAYLPVLSHSWLAVISWFSLAIRQPFTLGIAKLTAPREVWQQPLFVRTNVIITTVWATAFTLGAAAMAGCVAEGAGRFLVIAVQIASFVIPMVFTVRYVAVVQRRVAALHAQLAAER